MTTHRRFGLKSVKLIVWSALAAPALILLVRYALDALSYGMVVHQSGLWSAALLALVLMVTPLSRFWPRAKLSQFLRRHRRAIGVASFGYAAVHTGVYLARKVPLGKAAEEAVRPDLLTGWIAFAIFIVLAVTSNNKSVEILGRRWQALHRLVYLAAALIAVHWALATLEYGEAIAFVLFLIGIEALRVLRKLTTRQRN